MAPITSHTMIRIVPIRIVTPRVSLRLVSDRCLVMARSAVGPAPWHGPLRAHAREVQGQASQPGQQQAHRGEDRAGGGGCRVDQERDDEQGSRGVTQHRCILPVGGTDEYGSRNTGSRLVRRPRPLACRPESKWTGGRSRPWYSPAASGAGPRRGESRPPQCITCLPELEAISGSYQGPGQLYTDYWF